MSPRPPPGLGKPGRALWRGTLASYELSAPERALLAEACRVADRLAGIAAALDGADLTVKGSMGQDRPNPLLASSALLAHSLTELVRALALPVEGEDVGRVRSPTARDAANARWSRGA
jgi:hypothetical protein